MVTALEVALRNSGIRRLQIVWGAAIAAEWGHFVALGVFAYQRGGTGAVGVAGLVRLLPAAFIAPAAALFADRFRRERGLFTLTPPRGVALSRSSGPPAAPRARPRSSPASGVGPSATVVL